MVYLSFYLAVEAVAAAETKSSEVKDTQVVEAVAAVELLLCTLTLKKLMMLIKAATY